MVRNLSDTLPLARSMSEDELRHNTEQLAQVLGWRWTHFRPALTARGYRTPLEGSPGFFDDVFARQGHILLVEFKSERGRFTDDQEGWHFEIDGFRPHSDWICRVWFPRDWFNGTIEEALK